MKEREGRGREGLRSGEGEASSGQTEDAVVVHRARLVFIGFAISKFV